MRRRFGDPDAYNRAVVNSHASSRTFIHSNTVRYTRSNTNAVTHGLADCHFNGHA